MIEWWDYYLYGYDAPERSHGSVTTLPLDQVRDVAQELRDVVAEVTGEPCEAAERPRIGFI